jgi:hypothetical protein
MLQLQKVNPADVKRALMARGIDRSALDGMRPLGGISFGKGRSSREISRLVRMSNPQMAGVEDKISQPIYDSFSLAQSAAFPQTLMFTVPKGASGKTLAQTNMTAMGQLQFPQRLWLCAIYFVIANNTVAADVINIQNLVSFTLNVGTKNYLQVPAGFLTAGRGLVMNAIQNVGQPLAAGGAVTAYATSNGIQDPRAIFSLDNPFMIEYGESFNVTLVPETPFNMTANSTNPPGVGTQITVYLDGTLYRSVQ